MFHRHHDQPYPGGGEQHIRADQLWGDGLDDGDVPIGHAIARRWRTVDIASNKSVKPIASYPSDSSGNAAVDGSTNPTSWTAAALNGGGSGTGNTTTAYAVCSGSGINVSGITVTVKHTNVSGPTSASSSATATTSACGAAGNLISGGASISGSDPTTGSFTAPGSQGDHLNGDYPSDSSGNPTSNGNAPTNWTTIGHTGGSSSPNTDTDVWGLCMN